MTRAELESRLQAARDEFARHYAAPAAAGFGFTKGSQNRKQLLDKIRRRIRAAEQALEQFGG